MKTIPSDEALARAAFPWISFEGRWGELQPAFFNGPTGPNLKTQWTEPIRWSEDWRARSYTVSAAGAFGPAATTAICASVGGGSRALVQFVANEARAGDVCISMGCGDIATFPTEVLHARRAR